MRRIWAWMWCAAAVLAATGCGRPQASYSRASPEAVVQSAVLMVQHDEADRLTELVYADDVQMRSLLNQVGRAIGAMKGLSEAIEKHFPEELAELRTKIEADGGKSLFEMMQSGGGPEGGAGFRELAKQIFADPLGWLDREGDKLDVIYMADDTYGVMYDGKPLLQPWGVLIQEKEDGWYLMLPTNLPGARQIIPDTADEYMLWGSLFKSIENGVKDMTRDVDRGKITSMNQLGQEALKNFAIPAVMIVYAYQKYMKAEREEARAAMKEAPPAPARP